LSPLDTKSCTAALILVNENSAPSAIQIRMVKRSQSWRTRSLLSRFAHVVERSGLALSGGSCGLFVAAHLARSDFNLISSGSATVAMMIYGAVGFYLGIDLPHAPEQLRELPLRRLGSKTDAVELLSAAGTFLTEVAAVIAVLSIILDEIARSGNAATVLMSRVAGASMQIAAGILARLGADTSSVLTVLIAGADLRCTTFGADP
jgi:hypothetical protein